MKLIWTKEYETGIDKIDSQHKKLVELTNKLYNDIFVNKSGLSVKESVIELKLFTIFHFSHEQKLFKKYGYNDSEYEEHIKGHESFTEKVGEFMTDGSSSQIDLGYRILDFLKSYIAGHILVDDMKFVSYLKKNHFTEINLDDDISYIDF